MESYGYFRASGSELCLSLMVVMLRPKPLILGNLERTILYSFTPRNQMNIGYSEVSFQLTFVPHELAGTEAAPAESD